MSTNTANKGYILQVTGENPNSWGTQLDNNFISVVDLNLGGNLSLSVAGSSNVTLTTGTSGQSANLVWKFTGILTGNITVAGPAAGWIAIVDNETSGNFTLGIITSAGGSTGPTVPQNARSVVYSDGTNCHLANDADTSGLLEWAVAGGTSDAITATMLWVPAALFDGMRVRLRALAANATTTPTFAPNGLAAKTITKYGGKALAPGDIFGSGHEIILVYNLANTRWELLNPTTPAQTSLSTGATALFNFGLATFIRGYIAGLTLSNDGTSPNTVIDISTGTSVSDAQDALMASSAFTKTTGNWSAGTGAGGLDTGSVANNTWYHVFQIFGSTVGTDFLISTSTTSPVMPASYTSKRRIGSFKTDGSAHILSFTQTGDMFLWAASIADVSGSTTSTSAILYTLSVPLGVKLTALVRMTMTTSAASGCEVRLSSPDENDVAVNDNGDIGCAPSGTSDGRMQILTNTSAQIRARSNQTSGTIFLNTFGWLDSRGKFA